MGDDKRHPTKLIKSPGNGATVNLVAHFLSLSLSFSLSLIFLVPVSYPSPSLSRHFVIMKTGQQVDGGEWLVSLHVDVNMVEDWPFDIYRRQEAVSAS